MLAAIKIRGSNKTEIGIKKAFKELRLNRNNHLVLVDQSQLGQLKKAKDYITWGEIDKEHLVKLLKERGEMVGGKPISDNILKELGFSSFEEMASKLIEGNLRIKDIPEMKPVFRMNPPKGGYRSTKRPYSMRGDLGYRGNAINNLIDRMLEGGEIGKTKN
ncbi:MAG: 50S ribosomal protein L30 [Thermoplasmatales archaeon]